jgi:hypothetical protein
LHGRFDLTGVSRITAPRLSEEPLAITLQIDLAHGTDQISGRVTEGHWMADLAGDRNVFNAHYNPAPQAGVHSFVLVSENNTTNIAATGSSRILLGGATAVRGKLRDGRAFVTASILARNGDYPFFLTFNRGSEVLIGWLNFPAGPTPAPGGSVVWMNAGTNGFAATLQAAAAPN